MEALRKFYDMLKASAIMRQQVYQLVGIVLGFVGAAIDVPFLQEQAEIIIDGLLRGTGALLAIYTMITRAFKPAPNLSKTADEKETKLVAEGKLPLDNATHKVAVAAETSAAPTA